MNVNVEKDFVGGILHSTLSSGVLVGEMDIILISSLWEGFDREVRHYPSREDKINWDSIRMKTILFSWWNRKYILISVGFAVVLAPVLVLGGTVHSWVRCQHWQCCYSWTPPGGGPGNITGPHSSLPLADWLVAAVGWVISCRQHHSQHSHSRTITQHQAGWQPASDTRYPRIKGLTVRSDPCGSTVKHSDRYYCWSYSWWWCVVLHHSNTTITTPVCCQHQDQHLTSHSSIFLDISIIPSHLSRLFPSGDWLITRQIEKHWFVFLRFRPLIEKLKIEYKISLQNNPPLTCNFILVEVPADYVT